MSTSRKSFTRSLIHPDGRGRRLRRWGGIAFVASAALIATTLTASLAQAQLPIRSVGATTATAPTTVTPRSAVAAKATTGRVRGNFRPANTKIPAFRPTMGKAAYAAAKAAAGRAAHIAKPAAVRRLAPPNVIGQNFAGTDQPTACGCLPPDTHGAVGPSHYLQIVNSRMVVYNKSTNAILKAASLNSFFGYTQAGSTLLFDPRAAYDPVWNRFVLTADSFLDANNNQYFFIAVSKTADPTGAWWIFKLLINGSNSAVFFDYPQLGMDNGAILVTANVFGTGGNVGTAYFFKKSALYNGLSFNYWRFGKLAPWTIAATTVLDYNATTFEVSAPGSGAFITKFGFKDTDRDPPALTQNVNIPVASYSMPPNARQPGTAATLDTLDSRFVDRSTQTSSSIFNTHTIALGSFPAPKFYEFNTLSNTVVRSGFYFASGTSDDWNASIAANRSREVFVTWSSTDSPVGVKPQVRVSGNQPADAGSIPAGTAVATSTDVYTSGSPQRWGDYSSTTLDPSAVTGCAANRRAWGTNETVIAGPTWGTQITRFGFC